MRKVALLVKLMKLTQEAKKWARYEVRRGPGWAAAWLGGRPSLDALLLCP